MVALDTVILRTRSGLSNSSLMRVIALGAALADVPSFLWREGGDTGEAIKALWSRTQFYPGSRCRQGCWGSARASLRFLAKQYALGETIGASKLHRVVGIGNEGRFANGGLVSRRWQVYGQFVIGDRRVAAPGLKESTSVSRSNRGTCGAVADKARP